MVRKGFKQFITNQILNHPYNTPIYTTEIAGELAAYFHISIKQAKGLVNVNLPRIAEDCKLVRFRKGIYYRAEDTVFGKAKLNPMLVNRDRYLIQGGQIIGYETGAAFLNQIGLTTQIPRYRRYATNRFKYRGTRTDKKLQLTIQKPKTMVNQENYQYLQLLDAIENKEKVAYDIPQPEKHIYDYILEKGLDMKRLFEFAKQYYNETTCKKIFNIYALA